MDQESKDPHSWPTAAAEPPNLAERRRAFGERMRAMRETHGMTDQALAQMTRISLAFIRALESGSLERLPGEVFGRGFVRSIAKNLGVDSTALLAEFDGLWEKAPPRSVLKVEIKNKPVRVRSDWAQAITVNARSLVRRGIAVRVVLPAAGAVALIYGLAATPLLKMMAHRLRSNAAAVAPARPLDLSPAPQEGDGMAPTAVQPETGKAGASTEASPPASGLAKVTNSGPGPSASSGATNATPSAASPRTQDEQGAKSPGQADAAIKPAPNAGGEQVLEIVVSEPVRIKLDVDHGPQVTKELTPDTYRFTFTDRADMMVYDAAAVKVSFNGHALGSLGTKGRVRRLSFQAHTPDQAKKL